MSRKFRFLAIGLIVMNSVGCSQAEGEPVRPVAYPFVLTPAEIAQARELAEKDWHAGHVQSGPRTVFVKVELLPDSQGDSAHRLVMVQHYRYGSDETIFTMIDLRAHAIVQRETHAHYPTALAQVEVDRATALAQTDARLKPILDIAPTHFEARPIQHADRHHALFGHRLVHLQLMQGRNALTTPHVLVDLTTESVHLE